MDNLKLYNWYGEEFEPILPEIGHSLKAYKHHVRNIHTRSTDKINLRKKIEKDLFLRARYKITTNLKRELSSHKVAFKNKTKVIQDSIRRLKHSKNLETLIKFEIKKIQKQKQDIKIYSFDFLKSLEKTADDLERKKLLINNLIHKTKLEENDLFKKYCIFSISLLYLKSNKSYIIGDLIKIDTLNQSKLHDFEKECIKSLENPNQFFTDFLNELEKSRIALVQKKLNLKEELKQTKSIEKRKFIIEKNNIKLSAKKRIIELEYDYNQKIEQQKTEAKEIKAASLKKIKENKEAIISVQRNNKHKIYKIKHSTKKKLAALKKTYKSAVKSEMLKIDDILQKEFDAFINKYNLELAYNKDTQVFYKKYFFNIFNKLKVKKEVKQYLKSSYLLSQSQILEKTSYESKFKKVESDSLRDKVLEDKKIREKYIFEKIQAKYTMHTLKKENKLQLEKSEFKKNKNQFKKNYLNSLKEFRLKRKAKEITKQAFQNKKIELKVAYKESVRECVLNSQVFRNKNILKTHEFRKLSERKINKKLYDSKITEAQKSIPTECIKNLRYYSLILGFLFPGLSEILFFKQRTKGVIMLLVAVLIWTLVVPFSFGAYWSKMNGIPGLYDLGSGILDAQKGIFPDARYYLFGAVISIFAMIFSIIYLSVSSISSFRVAKALEQGSRPSNWTHTKRWIKTGGFPWMISIGGWTLMIFIVAAPIVTSVLLSFTNYGFNHQAPTQAVDWVGLKQWGLWWVFRENNLFLSLSRVIGWTIVWTISSTLIPITLGIIIAILANNNRIKGRKFFRVVFILPWAIPAFISIMFLRNAFQGGQYGYINYILLSLGIIKESVNWLNQIDTARALVILVQTWIGYAWIFMLVTGNLQSIPKDIYEAASVDGAKGKDVFIKITLPSLLLSIAPMLIGQFVGAFNNFTTISLFTGGGPAFAEPTVFGEASTDIIISWVYKLTTGTVQIDGNQAFAAALTTFASIFSIAIAAKGFIKSMSRRD